MVTNMAMMSNLLAREDLGLPVKEKGSGMRMMHQILRGELSMIEEYTGSEEYVPITPEQEKLLEERLMIDP
jgi:hypothetical protein